MNHKQYKIDMMVDISGPGYSMGSDYGQSINDGYNSDEHISDETIENDKLPKDKYD